MTRNVVVDSQTGAPVRTALLLAAGTGSRLQPLTDSAPKCLTEIHGIPILDQQIRCLEDWGFERLVIVTGYMEECIREFIELRTSRIRIEYIISPCYRTTNNIYSLWLAREVIREPVLLMESDLFFDTSLLGPMLRPDTIAVSTILPWMNGSTVESDREHRVVSLDVGAAAKRGHSSLKTVNICSLSENTWRHVVERLDRHVAAGNVGGYYEIVLSELIAEKSIALRSVLFDDQLWYEVDTMADLRKAEQLFSGLMQSVPTTIR